MLGPQPLLGPCSPQGRCLWGCRAASLTELPPQRFSPRGRQWGRYRCARKGRLLTAFPIPSAFRLRAARPGAPQCSSQRSALRESHQYFMEPLPPGEGLRSLCFCRSQQRSCPGGDHPISFPWQPAPSSPPFPFLFQMSHQRCAFRGCTLCELRRPLRWESKPPLISALRCSSATCWDDGGSSGTGTWTPPAPCAALSAEHSPIWQHGVPPGCARAAHSPAGQVQRLQKSCLLVFFSLDAKAAQLQHRF